MRALGNFGNGDHGHNISKGIANRVRGCRGVAGVGRKGLPTSFVEAQLFYLKRSKRTKSGRHPQYVSIDENRSLENAESEASCVAPGVDRPISSRFGEEYGQ